MSKIKIQCDNCNSEFKRESKEVTRSKKKGRKQYCSRTCAGNSMTNIKHIKSHGGINSVHDVRVENKRDEFTGFRYYLRKARSRDHEVNVTLREIKDLWELQRGQCVYTGVGLTLILETKGTINDPRYTASLDRIDSERGYVKENLQFISVSMNYMKNTLTHKETNELIELIKRS